MLTVTEVGTIQVEKSHISQTIPPVEERVVSPDGQGGVLVHTERMNPETPYILEVGEEPLIVMKRGGEVLVYGFPE